MLNTVKILNQLLIFMILYQYEKIQAISSICSTNVGALKIQQSDWSRAFWSICSELDFSEIWALKDRIGSRMKNFNILSVH